MQPQFEIGKQYELVGTVSSMTFCVSAALYVGSYRENIGGVVCEPRSNRFVHVVKDKDFVDFVSTWVYIACNVSLEITKSEEFEGGKKASIMQTDVYDDKFLNGTVVVNYSRGQR